MTGKALEYFNAFARCCPPQPEVEEPPEDCRLLLTRRYSMRHWRSRIKLGTLIIKGTKYEPPQALSGLAVEEYFVEKNMQEDTKRSPRTLA